MRLISAEVKGYGRLAGVKVNLDSKLIAIVGPNEAGKTTLLRALSFLTDSGDQPLNPQQRSRSFRVDDDQEVAAASYVLDGSDVDALSDLNLDQQPERIRIGRFARGGVVTMQVTPPPRSSATALRNSIGVIEGFLGVGTDFDDLLNHETTYSDHGSDAARDFPKELSELLAEVKTRDAGSQGDLAGDLATDRVASLLAGIDPESGDGRQIVAALSSIGEWLNAPDPGPKVRETLYRLTPRFLMFDEEDRALVSAYPLDDALRTNTPRALDNLARLASLDLNTVVEQHLSGDYSRAESAINKANLRLGEIFKASWKQSALSAALKLDGSILRVNMLENGQDITVFDERSAGLKMYVALLAFLARSATSVAPVLLIDEAENHLHINAQADLVEMLEEQTQAAKVIYTTHSPACLPPDLGRGVRSIAPVGDGSQSSYVANNFWSTSAGFNPLMLAMGAGAAAFTPARLVVLAEGASDMILLPSIFRKATGRDKIPFQVAPGLSEVPKDFYPQLDLEAASVVYLVDGDDGGETLRKALAKSGVDDKRIFKLPVPGVENLIDKGTYFLGYTSALSESNVGIDVPSAVPGLSAAHESPWATQLDGWATAQNLRPPSKVAVASKILYLNETLFVSEAMKPAVRQLFDDLLAALAP